jgi:hypothetical protein
VMFLKCFFATPLPFFWCCGWSIYHSTRAASTHILCQIINQILKISCRKYKVFQWILYFLSQNIVLKENGIFLWKISNGTWPWRWKVRYLVRLLTDNPCYWYMCMVIHLAK